MFQFGTKKDGCDDRVQAWERHEVWRYIANFKFPLDLDPHHLLTSSNLHPGKRMLQNVATSKRDGWNATNSKGERSTECEVFCFSDIQTESFIEPNQVQSSGGFANRMSAAALLSPLA